MARKKFCKVRSEVFRIHQWFRVIARGEHLGGVVRRRGVTFFIAGRNASHEFYVGAKNGQRYVLSMTGDWEEDENGKEVFVETEDLRPVETWGYIGHA